MIPCSKNKCALAKLLLIMSMRIRSRKPMTNLFLLLFSLFFYFGSSTFTITNYCRYTIWPATLSGAGTPPLPTTGFELASGQSVSIPSVPGWSGRIWGRTGCKFDALGAGTCLTGDCGGKLECNGMGATPPASLFEVTLGHDNDTDFYDVSLVDGYNLPLIAAPRSVNGGCYATGCATDINTGCPKELQVASEDGGEAGGVIGCKSACEAFGQDQYCCSGEFANPTTCQPSFYSTVFKRACPRAYSYAFDDGSSIFTCNAYEYNIIFCPNPNSMKRSNDTSISPPIQKSSNREFSGGLVSSSNVLVPVPLLVLPLFAILL